MSATGEGPKKIRADSLRKRMHDSGWRDLSASGNAGRWSRVERFNGGRDRNGRPKLCASMTDRKGTRSAPRSPIGLSAIAEALYDAPPSRTGPRNGRASMPRDESHG